MSTKPLPFHDDGNHDGDRNTPPDVSDHGALDPSLQTSNYEVIRKRLVEQGLMLAQKAKALNALRQEFFGKTMMEVVGNETVNTENNCIPQDIINLGDNLLFGYNVHMRNSKTQVADVFSLHKFERRDGVLELRHLPQDTASNFLSDETFVEDFNALYFSFQDSFLTQLRRTKDRQNMLALFQVGTRRSDVRVFHWRLAVDAGVHYVSNAADKLNTRDPAFAFEWTKTRREDHVVGRHPHIQIVDKADNNKLICFVETIGGDLTIKIENNAEDGKGIYSEPVEYTNQALGDADIYWSRAGNLAMLKIKPGREDAWRYFVFNMLTKEVLRLDAIASSCVALPEDHGIIFPGGFVLETGGVKTFESDTREMHIHEIKASPNGEDVLYAFYREGDGQYLLLSYNLIRKEIMNPILCHGYSIFDDGLMIVFRSTGDMPTRMHPMQIWRTPYVSHLHAASVPRDGSFMSRIGNAELVRGVSDAFSIRRMINNQEPTTEIYTAIISAAERMIDLYYWLGEADVEDMSSTLKDMVRTCQLVIDEFEKVGAMRDQAQLSLREVEREQANLVAHVRHANWSQIDRFVKGLDALRAQRGKLITLKEMKYIDVARLNELEQDVIASYDRLSSATVKFLLGEGALTTYFGAIEDVIASVEELATTLEAQEAKETLDHIGDGLNLLTQVVGGLKIDDPMARTQVLEHIAKVLSQQNRARAMIEGKRRVLLEHEGKAEFAVQFQLLGQSVTSALGMSDTPEKCDDQLARLMVQLEEIESRFSQFDQFLAQLGEKREEIYEVLETRKQQLVDDRQRQASNVSLAAERILEGLARRAHKMEDIDTLHAYFAADAMVLKVREMADKLRLLKDPVKADDIEAKIKATRDQAIRTLRDKIDLFSKGQDVIKLGRHHFSINTQALELTMVPRGDEVRLHITGTDFYEQITDQDFLSTRDLWSQHLISETKDVYRAEYLAACILFDAERRLGKYSVQELHELAMLDDELMAVVRAYSEERYDEGYERGVHDADTLLILRAVLSVYMTAGLLRFGGKARALAVLFWAAPADDLAGSGERQHVASPRGRSTQRTQVLSPAARARVMLARRAQSLGRLRAQFDATDVTGALCKDLEVEIHAFMTTHNLPFDAHVCPEAAEYLVKELVKPTPRFIISGDAQTLMEKFLNYIDATGSRSAFDDDLHMLAGEYLASYELIRMWMTSFLSAVRRPDESDLSHALDEAIVALMVRERVERFPSSTRTHIRVERLLGQHPRIERQVLTLRLDAFLGRLKRYIRDHIPRYRAYRKMSHDVLERERKKLKLSELKPRVLSTFVRNKLIDEVYLPIIGDNLAKQMGSVGETGRSDRMGLLLLISPPGYGKTTLMEYTANRLGLTFMKINGPALGHHVTSLDPSEAPNATARQEVDKINLALRMGNNVMLYLDDIQHTHPELLQKFISLCDATRRIEGVWDGETKTYDLRGKRFCVVMAGNPYTERGERFQIPDMLANRADTYNLGDILDGSKDVFALSYIENALTSNPVTAPLAHRDKDDIYVFIRMAQGEHIPSSDLKYNYSALEVAEIVDVLKKLFFCQRVLLKVNQEYIRSASQDDAFRTEPPFKLQGSYRNMTKLAEKVVSALNAHELEALVDDHYLGEAQTLTKEAEQNLLKLMELRGRLTGEKEKRWEEIKREFQRRAMMGGGDDDPVSRVMAPLSGLVQKLDDVHTALSTRSDVSHGLDGIRDALMRQWTQSVDEVVASEYSATPATPVEDVDSLGSLVRTQSAMVESTLQALVRIVEQHVTSQAALGELATQLRGLELWLQRGQGGGHAEAGKSHSGQVKESFTDVRETMVGTPSVLLIQNNDE